MSEPRRRDADLRPPYRGAPGSYPTAQVRGPGAGQGTHLRPSPPGPRLRPWGTLPGRSGICIVIAGAALGAAVTVLAGSEPGVALGVFLVVATVAGAFAVQPRAAYRLIPAPALAYVAAAAVAGLIRDRATDTSLTGLAVSAARWIASGFVAMSITTILAIAITIARWQWGRRSHDEPERRF